MASSREAGVAKAAGAIIHFLSLAAEAAKRSEVCFPPLRMRLSSEEEAHQCLSRLLVEASHVEHHQMSGEPHRGQAIAFSIVHLGKNFL